MEGYTYKITTDFIPRSSKPIYDWEKSNIYKNLVNQVEVSIPEFSELVAVSGCTWSGGIFSGYTSNENWREQSVIGLDFDRGTLTPEQVFDRLSGHRIHPQLWYHTFSSTIELIKFRVIIFLDEPITDSIIFNYIIGAIYNMFTEEIDTSCKNPSRYFFGGIDASIISMEPVSTIDLLNSLILYTYAVDSKSFRKIPQYIFDYIKKKSAEFPQLLYSNYRNYVFSAEEKIYNPTLQYGGKNIKIDIQELRKKFILLDKFLDGEWLYHNQIFGLATNLKYIEGGLLLMKKTMKKFNGEGKTKYTDNNFNILPCIRKADYYPKLIQNFSPYESDWEFNNIFDMANDRRGHIEIIKPIERMSLSEAERLMQEKYNDLITSGEIGKIYIFKLPTAIGKTELITNTTATICFPTNDLKNEVSGRMKLKSVTTPDRLVFSEDRLNNKINIYYKIGLHQHASRIIYSVAEDIEFNEYSENDVMLARKYVHDLEKSKSSGSAVLTTHNRSLFTEFLHDTIIYDEDPLQSILGIKETKISDLFALSMVENTPFLNDIVNDLMKSKPNEVYKLNNYGINLEDVLENLHGTKIDTNIIEFLTCQFYIRDVKNKNKIIYINRVNLPSDKKIMIMSATIPVEIYQKLYGERIKVIDITNVEQVGEVIQHTSRSCSRDGLKHYGEEISEQVGELPVITFMKMKHLFKNPIQELHFGNCSGSDKYNGQDIAVVGTPHHNNHEYFLISAVLGIDLSKEDKQIFNQKVVYNGFRFMFKSFDGDEIRKIQLSLIESDLIQAVGRARTLRTNAKVELFSNFPLIITTDFI